MAALPCDGQIPYAGLTYVGTTTKKGYLYGLSYAGGTKGAGTAFKISTTGQYQVLYNFGSQSGDGGYPIDTSGLALRKGRLYGTTSGSDTGEGIVFEMTLTGNENKLYTFVGPPGDIGFPVAGVVSDREGNLFGSSDSGGAYGYGAVYEVTPGGEEKLLWSFGGESSDGQGPIGGVVIDGTGNIYGTTFHGGAQGYGTVGSGAV